MTDGRRQRRGLEVGAGSSLLLVVAAAVLAGCGSEPAREVADARPAAGRAPAPDSTSDLRPGDAPPAVPGSPAGSAAPPDRGPAAAGNAAQGDAARGAVHYATLCATCHGARGEGDGPVAAGLDPKPARHSDRAYMDSLSDEHLFRVITDGGPAVGKSPLMAPWGGTLSSDQVWDVVAFVRTLARPSGGD